MPDEEGDVTKSRRRNTKGESLRWSNRGCMQVKGEKNECKRVENRKDEGVKQEKVWKSRGDRRQTKSPAVEKGA